MDFTKWYKVKENSKILILDKEKIDIKKYSMEKYDYIYLNGTLENIDIDMLKSIKQLLNESGTLFIAVDNKNGVKYLVGNKSEHCNKIYDSIKGKFKNGKLYTKNELDKIIKELGFKYFRYYYPLPNYNNPSVIYTDNYLPSKNNSKINYNVIYDEESLIVQDEIDLLKMFTEENKFTEFTNSYIIELSNSPIDEKVKYYSFNNMRKDKYSLILKMTDEYVEKIAENEQAIEHINNINKNSKTLKDLGFNLAEEETQGIVKSKLIKFKQLDECIINLLEKNQIENVYQLIENWYKYIEEKLKPNEKGFVQHGFIDMVFENTFYNEQDKEYIFFDQEWYKKNIPIKFILYRAIKNLYAHNPKIENNITQTEILKHYNIKDDEYKIQEEQIQNEVIDTKKQEFYSKQYNYRFSPEEIKQIIKDVKKLDKDNVELIQEIKRLETGIVKKDEIIRQQQENLNKSLFDKVKDKIFNNKG